MQTEHNSRRDSRDRLLLHLHSRQSPQIVLLQSEVDLLGQNIRISAPEPSAAVTKDDFRLQKNLQLEVDFQVIMGDYLRI